MRYSDDMTARRRYIGIPVKRTSVTIPIDLLAYMQGLAAHERMSISGMIVRMIEWHRQGKFSG